MKTIQVTLCQRIATLALIIAAVPRAGLAQEQEPVASTLAEAVREVRYVSDKLVLNVYAEPDQDSARVATIQTGDAVDELERSANMVRVRLDDGREGWVGSNYLTSDAPAVVRLRELQAERRPSESSEPDKKLTAENVTLKKENSALQAQVSELRSAVAAAPVAVADAMPIGVTTTAEVISTEPAPATVTSSGPGLWGWTIIAAVLAGSLGYVSGYQALARRLRKKFGGLKVY